MCGLEGNSPVRLPAESEIEAERERGGCVVVWPAIIVAPSAGTVVGAMVVGAMVVPAVVVAAMVIAAGVIRIVAAAIINALIACGREDRRSRDTDYFRRRGNIDRAAAPARRQCQECRRSDPAFHLKAFLHCKAPRP